MDAEPLTDNWHFQAEYLKTARLELTPRLLNHVTEMTDVLSDPETYAYIGGGPPTESELRARYEFLEGQRSPDGTQGWLNWIVRALLTADAVGVVQATVSDKGSKADVSWIIAPRWQRRGFAKEATIAIVEWLGKRSVKEVSAYVKPSHDASRNVAKSAGLFPTDCSRDGEQRWIRNFTFVGDEVDR